MPKVEGLEVLLILCDLPRVGRCRGEGRAGTDPPLSEVDGEGRGEAEASLAPARFPLLHRLTRNFILDTAMMTWTTLLHLPCLGRFRGL